MDAKQPNDKREQRTGKESGSYQRAPAFRDSALEFRHRAQLAAEQAVTVGRREAMEEAARLEKESTDLAYAFERWLSKDVQATERLESVNRLAALQDDLKALETALNPA